jgi:hypothetical protein
MKLLRVASLIILIIGGLAVIAGAIYVLTNLDLEPHYFYPLKPDSYLNISTFTIFITCVVTTLLLYPIVKTIRWIIKKPAKETKLYLQPKTLISDKDIFSVFISAFLSIVSMGLCSYPIFFIILVFQEDINNYLSPVDFVILVVYILLLPLSGLIIAVISSIWKNWWLPKITLFFSCMELILALFLLVLMISPPFDSVLV